MERIKVVYKNNAEITFNAPDGVCNDIIRLIMSEQPPEFISSLEGSIYKFCLSLKGILFISLEKEDKTTESNHSFGFVDKH